MGERTPTSSTWANPDGTLITGQAQAPIWVRQGSGDGTTAADWATVDLTLQRGEDGSVRPVAGATDVVLAGAGTPDDGRLVSMTGPEGHAMGVEWTQALPEPRLEGPRAVYPGVQPGVDLVVEVTRTGFEQFFVLAEQPAPGEAPELSLRMLGDGLVAEATDSGGVQFSEAGGDVVAASGTPQVWDAAVDEERLHPLNQPWTDEGEGGSALAPMPDWGLPGAEEPQDSSPPAGADLLPPGADVPPPPATAASPEAAEEQSGQAGSEAAVQAGSSQGVPLTTASEVAAPGVVEVTLTPDEAYLQDGDTEYPVVVDPEGQWFGWFDTWTQSGVSGDMSASPELRIGTYDWGYNVAHSYLNLDLTGVRYRDIYQASLSLWNWHSWSCTPAWWEVWATDPAGYDTRWTNPARWWPSPYGGAWSWSDQTRGAATGACGDGWVSADLTELVQTWSNMLAGTVGIGLRAFDETDSFGWKKFNSANAAGNLPTYYIQWSNPPGPATGLSVSPSATESGTVWTGDSTPRLSATAHDPDGGLLDMRFQLWQSNGAMLWEGWANQVAAGQAGWVEVPAGILQEGGRYTFRVDTRDNREWNTYNSGWAPDFVLDTTAPGAPTVGSTAYPSDGQWHQGANVAGAFNLTMVSADTTLSGFEWGLDKTPDTRLAATGATTTLSVTPPTSGRHVLQVRSIDKAGDRSGIVNHVFYVGGAALSSPTDGAQVVRRVRLAVHDEPGYTHVKFLWRRGTDVPTGTAIPLPDLTRDDGRGLSDAWTAISDLGDYATWDAGSTLGTVAGPAQVQALVATDANGTGAHATQWVTITINPDAQDAATDSIGPGSVNLLTGDYRFASTDVDEFGLSIGRTTSSRDPRSGFQTQKELLTSAQQTVAAGAQYAASTASVERVTYGGRTGMDSLRVVPNSSNTDSYAYPGALNVGDIGLQAGRTYRLSAWVFVPSTTASADALDDDPRRASLQGFYRSPQTGAWTGGPTAQPTKVNTWQQLSVELAVPAGSGGVPHVRLYNGFGGTTKDVFFDDISVQEVWAPFGPQWALGTADAATGTAYTHISQPYPDVATLHTSDGGEIWFTGGPTTQVWWPQPGAESLKLTRTGEGSWRLTELDGTVSEFARQTATALDSALTMTSPPAASGQTRLVYENAGGRIRLARLIAPVEPGVDNAPDNGAACTITPYPAGCEILELAYATSTTATGTDGNGLGDFAGQVTAIRLHSVAAAGDPTTTAVTAATYRYDSLGRLRQVWDPRITPQPLKTTYAYDDDGRVTVLTPPGELPWRFTYGTGGANSSVGQNDLVDRSSGRLYSVTRASLVPGTIDQVGPDATSTVVYGVPLTRAAGGPYDLHRDARATWAQRAAPTDATAIFGPEDPPGLTTATATAPGPDGYRPATVHYLDSSGREVNTATPAGPDAPPGGFIDTAEYDQYGNVVRSLDATNRLLALGQLPSASDDLAALNLTPADTATRAIGLSSLSTFGPEGIDLLRTRGPLVRLAVGGDPNNVQLVHDVTTYAYDEGKPDGAAYHLVTTQTDALLIAGSAPEQLVDVDVTKNGYNPIDAPNDLQAAIGPTSGWKHGQPTVVTFDVTGANLSALVRYDAQGRPVESRGIGASGGDARTNVAVYYTAGPNGQQAACGNTPAYAGLPCMSYAAGEVEGHDASRMAGTLPVRHVTAYNRYGSIASVTESATGPVAGAATAVSRTTVTEYDAADRVVSVTLTGAGAGAGAPVAKTVNRYDAATGDVTVIEGEDPAGTVVSTVKKSFDLLGRMTRYEDGSGGWTTSVFDRFGKPTEVTDSTGASTSFTYDRAKEPRGFVTSVTDSVAGTISASYGPDGQVTEQVLPGGVGLRIGYDANRTPVSRTYLRSSDDAVIAASAAVENAAGQMVTHATPAASKRYTYDGLGRLTAVQDTIGGTGLCVARTYGYDPRGNRSSLTSAVSGTAVCADPGNPGGAAVTATSYTVDTADRLVTESAVAAGAWVYDPLGRITTAPVRGSPGATVTNAYFANDLIAAQTIDGVARQSWSLDAIGRFASYTNEAWAVGGDGQPGWQEAVTKVNHYDSDSDSPAWIAEDASLPDEITRYVDGLDGNLAVETGKSGARVLQLVDLHGDVMTTLPIRDGEGTADWTALQHQTADEFGNPTDLTTGAALVTDGQAPGKDGRYGWLGGKQRSADALAGVLLMGVRLYDPGTGRFWSRDPSPGGNSTAYDYCSADPVNCTDLDGHAGWFTNLVKKVAKKVAPIAEVVANVVPGPIGAAAGAISAGAYAATGNRRKALEMGVTAIAAMVPGGGAMAKAGFAAARTAGRVSARVGRTVAKPSRRAPTSCRIGPGNSFTPETGVLMADGTTMPISDMEVGDLVAARDPLTGEVTAQPVLDVIVGHGDRHLIDVVTAPAPAGALDDGQKADGDPRTDAWTATANHPIWVQGQGWTDADDLAVGDLLQGATGELRIVQDVDDHGWVQEQTVYNLSVANTHTYVVGYVGDTGDGTLVHNCSEAINQEKQLRHVFGHPSAAGKTVFRSKASAERLVRHVIRYGAPVGPKGQGRRRVDFGFIVGRHPDGSPRTAVTVVPSKTGWHGWPSR